MDTFAKVALWAIGAASALAGITITGAYCTMRAGEQDNRPRELHNTRSGSSSKNVEGNSESFDMDFSGQAAELDPEEGSADPSRDLSSAEEWAEHCQGVDLYSGEGCSNWSKVFTKAGVTVDDVLEFRRHGRAENETEPMVVLKMTKACSVGDCQMPDDESIEGTSTGKASDFYGRCRNVGMKTVDDCVQFALAGASPGHFDHCRREGIDDAYLCLLSRRSKAPVSKVSSFLEAWPVNTRLTDCAPETAESEEGRELEPWRHKNLRAMFIYINSDAEIPEGSIFPPDTASVPPGKAWAYQAACIPPEAGVKLHLYGIPADYATSMMKTGMVRLPGSELISAYYGCVSVEKAMVSKTQGAEDLMAVIYAVQEEREPHTVRRFMRLQKSRDCSEIFRAMDAGLSMEEADAMEEEGVTTLYEMTQLKTSRSGPASDVPDSGVAPGSGAGIKSAGGFTGDNPYD